MKNIPNYISISRIIMSIALLIPKTFSITFYIIYIYCGLSDMLDGFLARKYKITSELGAKIDSIADMIFVSVSILKIIPFIEISIAIYIWIIIVVLIKVFNIILGYIQYKKLILLHTVANKITGFVLFIIPLIIGFIDIKILESLICGIATFSAIQEGYYIKIGKNKLQFNNFKKIIKNIDSPLRVGCINNLRRQDMYKIGDFSKMSKTTIKALRYYEKEGLLKPAFIDQDTSYRYYESSQLVDISKIISLRQIGLSIKDIKKVLDGQDISVILNKRKNEIEKNIANFNIELSKINYLLEENNMKNEIFIKDIPSYIIYYRDGMIEDLTKITEFVLQAGTECAKANPNLKCITPDYCYISYLDGEYKEKDIKIRYAQAVENLGNETDKVKFMKSNPITAVCIYHKGTYNKLRDSYNIILKYIEDNGYEIIDNARECYIDGCWNKENEEDYLTEIQFPVKKR